MGFELRDVPGIIAGIALCQLAGIVGMAFTTPAIPTWYAALNKPFFTPPSWVFGPAWILLYTLMGIAVYMVWDSGIERHEVRRALAAFAVQLALNALWSAAFFGMQSPLYGLVVIILLLITLAATTALFYRISKVAAYLLVPYFLWGCFASLLNLFVLLMNP